MPYDAGTAFLQVVPSFAGVVTAIDAEAAKWGTEAGAAFKAGFESQVQDLGIGVGGSSLSALALGIQHSLEQALGGGAGGVLGPGGPPDRGGANWGGIIGMLLWGGGGVAGIGAGFGSILSLAGFGIEHLITTAIGLLGSFGLALGGAMALAAGALSIFGVGFLTDLGGIGQAAGDIKTVYTALSTYQTMQQGLAKQIPQTAAAQTALNTALAGFAPAARSAVLAAALTASQFHWMYDQVTGTAEAIGANIINQAMQVGEKFLPILGQFAATNMAIIQSGLQPLFQFLGTTGVADFTNLENIFTARLPTAMAALNQGVQVLVNTLNFLANQTTGGFMQWLLGVFTYLNSPAGTAKLDTILTHMIADFHVWFEFFKQVFDTIVDIFSQSQGLGTGIIQTLTQMLKSLDQWLTSTGKNSLATLFLTHKQEVIDLLKAVGDLIAAFGKFYLTVSPLFIRAATAALGALGGIFSLMASNPISAYALALTLVAVKLGIIIPLLSAFGVDLGAVAASAGTAAAGLIGLDTSLPIGLALLANPVMWAIAAAAGAALAVTALEGAIKKTLAKWSVSGQLTIPKGQLGAGAPEDIDWQLVHQMAKQGDLMAIQQWDAYQKKLKELQKSGVSPGNSPWQNLIDQLGAFASSNIVTTSFEKVWREATQEMQIWGADIKNWFTSIPGDIGSWIKGWGVPLKNWFAGIPGDILGWLKSWATDIKNWFTDLPKNIGNIPGILVQIGKDLVGGLLKGIQDAWHTITSWIGSAIGGLSSVAKAVLGIHSPSTVFYGIGQSIGDGLAEGMQSSTARVTAASRGMLSGLTAVSGAVSLNGAPSNSVLAALQRIEAAVVQVPSATGAAVSTKIDTKLTNTLRQHAKITLTAARTGAA